MFARNIFIVACLLFAGNSMAQHTYGSFYTHDAFINYILSENKTENAVIVMVPGLPTYHPIYMSPLLMVEKVGPSYLQTKGTMYIW
jgi:hypothetical protein